MRIIFTSSIPGVVSDAIITPGSTAFGTDTAAELNKVLQGGNINLIVDGTYGLHSSLVLYSHTTISVLPGCGFIMQPDSNASMVVNAHLNGPTMPSGTGGYLVSNIEDINITIDGGMWNSQADGSAVTNPNHKLGVDDNFLLSFRFSGVNGLTIKNTEIYDSPTYGIGIGNSIMVRILDNYVHQPKPLTIRNNGTIQFEGPDQYLWISGNRINAGDDSIALNAEDGNEPGTGDKNAKNFTFPYYKWGPITDAWLNNNYFDNSNSGIRLLSCHERIDRIFIRDTDGYTIQDGFNASHLYPLGAGNVGSVMIDGWNVQPIGRGGPHWHRAHFWVDMNIERLQISRVTATNPVQDWPVFNQAGQEIQELNLHDWTVFDPAGKIIPVIIQTNGVVASLNAGSINWISGTESNGSLFAGIAPSRLTLSNYTGPARILAKGYNAAFRQGDAFGLAN